MKDKEKIRKDVIRYSKLKPWYKTLKCDGSWYLPFPYKGKQPKKPFETIKKRYEIHWWFIESEYIDDLPYDGELKEYIMRHSVWFNCFLKGYEITENGEKYYKGYQDIIVNNPGIEHELRKKYENSNENKSDITLFFEKEREIQIEKAIEECRRIQRYIDKNYPKLLLFSESSNKKSKNTYNPDWVSAQIESDDTSDVSDTWSLGESPMTRVLSKKPGTPRKRSFAQTEGRNLKRENTLSKIGKKTKISLTRLSPKRKKKKNK